MCLAREPDVHYQRNPLFFSLMWNKNWKWITSCICIRRTSSSHKEEIIITSNMIFSLIFIVIFCWGCLPLMYRVPTVIGDRCPPQLSIAPHSLPQTFEHSRIFTFGQSLTLSLEQISGHISSNKRKKYAPSRLKTLRCVPTLSFQPWPPQVLQISAMLKKEASDVFFSVTRRMEKV